MGDRHFGASPRALTDDVCLASLSSFRACYRSLPSTFKPHLDCLFSAANSLNSSRHVRTTSFPAGKYAATGILGPAGALRHYKSARASLAELTALQHVRRYATEPPKSGGSNTLLYTTVALAATAGGFFYFRRGTPTGQAGAAPPSEEGKKIPGGGGQLAKAAFTGGEQGFLSLLLEKSEIINHNTKHLTFRLPEDDQVSGLPVACAFASQSPHQNVFADRVL